MSIAPDDRLLPRIAALLRQGESTDNPHEAEAFIAAAQRLATAASIDLASARAHSDRTQARSTPVQEVITIGEAGRRGLRTFVQLFVAIAAANDVTCDVANTSTTVYAFGFEEDITLVRQLYAHLVVQMVRASDAYIATGAHRDLGAGKPVATVTARINFQQGYAARIGSRLAAARAAELAAAAARESRATAGGISAALVLAGKDLEVKEFHSEHSSARGTWRGSRAGGTSSPAARAAGDRAARRARLGRATELPAARARLAR